MRRLLGLGLLAAVLVLWAGTAWAQTITISPTTAQTLREGEALKVTLTVTGLSTGQTASIDFTNTGRTASLDDFEVYQQANAPTGSDTPLTLQVLNSGYAYYDFATDSDPAGPVTFWVLAKTDTVFGDPDRTFPVDGLMYVPSPFSIVARSDKFTVTLTDATPIPAPTAKPTTPANLTATAGRGAVTLVWDAVNATSSNTNLVNDVQITKHQVRQSTDGGANYGTWTDIPDSAYGEVNAAGYTVRSLTDGTEYTFQVRAVNGFGNSDPATATMATPDAAALPPPTGLRATAGNTQVTLNWDDPGDATILHYEYQQKAGLAASDPWTKIGGSATTTSFRLTGLSNGTAYSYRIRKRDGFGTSVASEWVTATPRGRPPAAPVLRVIPRNSGVTLSWPNPFDGGITNYEYQYKAGTGIYGPWRVARAASEEDCGVSRLGWCLPPYVVSSGSVRQVPVDGLTNGTRYTFRIRAVSAEGKTVSNEAFATPVSGVPAKPAGLTTWTEQRSARSRARVRRLTWDPIVDKGILRYEFTVDEGRTWSFLSIISINRVLRSFTFPEGELVSDHTFRIRAVNALGPGPASEQAEDITVVDVVWVTSASLEWDAGTSKATLVWGQTEYADLRWWNVLVTGGTTNIPIGTTRYEIPVTYSVGETVRLYIAGCAEPGCASRYQNTSHRLSFQVGVPVLVTGFSATPGDEQITLSWDAPTGGSITHFEYEIDGVGTNLGANDIPDGDDQGNSAADETSYTVTGLENWSNYSVRLRAANANGHGPWSERIEVQPLTAGVPAQPSGVVWLTDHLNDEAGVTTWDDPQDSSITGYQQWDGSNWLDIPGSDATTAAAQGRMFTFRAVNANGAGPHRRPTIVISPAPAQPTGLKAAPGHRRVTLTWDDPGRGVYIASWSYTLDGGETWTDIPNSKTTGQGHLTRYTVTNLTNGQAYTFAVVAQNAVGTSPPSAAVTATPQDGPPAAFTGLVAEPGDGEVTLTWDDPRDPSITRYTITRQDVTSWSTITPVPGSRAGTTSHTVTGLTNGVSYQIRIAAVNELGSLRGSATGFITVTPGVPAAPASLSVVAGDAQAALTWTAPDRDNGSPVTGYEYTSNANTATPTWADVPDSGSDGRADERQYTVTGLVNNRTYTFAVRAENANGRGAATRARRAVPVDPQAPQRPAGLRANPGHQEVRLTWASPHIRNSVTAYQYRQSTDRGKTWSPDWTAIAGSNAGTTEHRLTGLANGTAYTFELRALKGAIAGPSARVRATPGQASASHRHIVDSRRSGSLTAPNGDTYRVTQLSPPEGLDWQIVVPGATDIDGRTLTVRSLQGTTPYTSPRHAFTSSGQEGLDIVVHPPISGAAQVCLEPSDLLRFEAESRPLLVLRYSGTSWTELPTSADGDMLCGTTAGFSAFVLGYASTTTTATTTTTTGSGGGGTPSAPANAPPTATQPLPPQTAAPGVTGEPLDLTPYFRDPDGDPLTYVAVSQDVGVVIADLARGSSELTLYGVGAGQAVVTVTASDPQGESVSQRLMVTVGAQAGTRPEVAQRILPQIVVAGAVSEPLDLTEYFRDPDGAPLTFAAVSYDPDVLAAEVAEGSSELVLRGIAAGDAVFIVTATDSSGGSAIQPVAVTVRANTALETSRFIAPQVAVVGAASEPLDLTEYFHDPEGDALSYVAASDDTDVLVAEVPEGSSRLVLRGVAPGEANVIVTAGDLFGERARQTVEVTVRTNAAPEVAQAIAPQVAVVGAAGEPLDLTTYFRDPDGDPLTYAAQSDNTDAVTAEVPAGSSQLLLSGVAAGEAVVTVTASDPYGGEVSQSLAVETNVGPAVLRPIAEQVVTVGGTSRLDLARHFWGPGGTPLTYSATALGSGAITAEVPAGGSQLVLSGVSVGVAVVVVTASDPYGGEVSQTFTVMTNSAPAVAQPLADQVVTVGGTSRLLDLARYFHDPDGDLLTYAAAALGSGAVIAEVPAGSSQLRLSGVSAGVAVVTVTASDLHGGEVSQSFAVMTNSAPSVVQPVAEQVVEVGGTIRLDLAPYFHDPDGDPLTYAAAIFGTGAVTAEVASGSSRLRLSGVSVGTAAIVVTASDPHGGEASLTLTVRSNAAPAVAEPGDISVVPAAVAAGGGRHVPRSASAGEAAIVVTAGDLEGGAASQALPLSSNSAPSVVQPVAEQVAAVGGTIRLDLAAYFHDPDGDPLTYAAATFGTGAVLAEVPAGGAQLTLRGVAAGQAVIVVTASDPHGGEVSQTLRVRTNAAPVVAQPIAEQVVAVGGTIRLDLAAYFHDPDGDLLTYVAQSDNPGAVLAEVPAGSSQLLLSGVSAGGAAIVVTASDSHGGEASQALRVRTSGAPAVARLIPDQVVTVGATRDPLELTSYFHDPDGDPLTYAAQSDNPGAVMAEVPAGGSRLTLRGVASGEAVVIVTASDSHGGEASQALKVRTNSAPTALQPIPEQVVAVGATSDPLELTSHFHDPDGDPLSYAAESDNPAAVVAAVAGGSRLVLSAVASGEAAVIVTAIDPYGGEVSQTLTVRTNSAPAALQPFPPQVVAPGGTSAPLELATYFHDPDGDPLTYAAQSDNPGAVMAEVPAGGSQLVLSGVSAGEAAVIVTAIDPYGGEVSQTLTVRTNSAPAALQPIPPQVVAPGASSEPLDLAGYFQDPDGDPLSYGAESDDPRVVVAAALEGGRLMLTGVAAGEAVVTVTASDPHGGSVSQSMTVRTNSAPVVVQPIPPQVVAPGSTGDPLDLTAYFRDPDGDPLTYAAESDNPGAVVAEVVEGGSELVLTGVSAGEAVIVVTASDPYGGTVSQFMAARANSAPAALQPLPPLAVALGASSEPLDLAAYFRDADGDPLTYAAESDDPEVMTAAVAGALFTVTGVGIGSAAATVTARDPHDAEASQSVSVTVRVAEPAWVKAWTARFGRTVTGQVLDGVQERLRVARQAGFEATLAGHRLDGFARDEEVERGEAALRRELGTLAGWMDGEMDQPAGGTPQALSGRDLLTSTAFTLTGGGPESGFGALWGRGVVSHFSGEDGALSLDGEVATGMLGADWVSGRWLAGLTLAMSRGTGGYRVGESSGDIESTLTGLYPWVGYRLTERLSLWTAAGYGAGVLTLTPPEQAPASTDLSLTLVAAGARSELFELPRLGGIVLALEADTRLTRTGTGATTGLDATDATVWQVRLGLEGSRHVALEGGGALRPSVELGLRHDGGDAETGGGVELGAGLSYTMPVSGLSLDLAARGLLAHRAPGLEEWGASASLAWDPTPSSDEGLSLSLQQSVGASSSGGLNALLARETMTASPGVGGMDPASRLQARAGYGLPMGNGRFVGTPQLGFGLSEGRHDYTLGWHLSVARREELDLTVGVEASRRENPDASRPEHGVMLQLRLGH